MFNKKSRKNNKKQNFFIGGEHKKALVICQRTKGLTIKKELVEEIIVPVLNSYIHTLLGQDCTIIYVTDISQNNQGTADYDCHLQIGTPCTTEFISRHGNSFDLIILQTCPFKLMRIDIINSLLKPDGYLGLTITPSKWSDLIPIEIEREKIFIINHFKSMNFVLESENSNIILLKKNTQNAGKKDKKRKSRKRV